jgi:flagellar biosynthesis protein FliR
MPWSIAQFYLLLPAFLLVLFRMSGLMLAAPLLGSEVLPAQLRALLAVAMSFAVFPMVVTHLVLPATLGGMVAGLVGELAIGLLIGLGVNLVFIGVQTAGQVVSQQAGLSLGDVYNPMLDTTANVLAEFYFVIAMLVFLAVGGDRAMIRAVLDSFTTLPPLALQARPDWAELFVDLLTLSFIVSIRLAGPSMLALLLAFVTLGFISRTVPQLNILTVGFPIKAALGILIVAITMMSMEPVLLDGLQTCMDGLRAALNLQPV